MIESYPVVKLAVINGGYLVEAACECDEDGEYLMKQHICLSVDEVLTRVRSTIETLDATSEQEAKSLEDAMKKKSKRKTL